MAYNVLIVDDSQTMRKVIRKSVILSGVELGECWEAGDGREALKTLHSHSINLILTDVNMPGMDGLELIRELQKEDSLRKIPVVLISSQKNEERFQEASALGVKGYLQKPFYPEALRDLLARIEGETRV
jgi:two-component system chemotaxis response regulator CheY